MARIHHRPATLASSVGTKDRSIVILSRRIWEWEKRARRRKLPPPRSFGRQGSLRMTLREGPRKGTELPTHYISVVLSAAPPIVILRASPASRKDLGVGKFPPPRSFRLVELALRTTLK